MLNRTRMASLAWIVADVLLIPIAAEAQLPSQAGAIGVAILPQDLSAWGMFASADWVVKGVIAGLAFASVLTWTVVCAKGWELLSATRLSRVGLAALHRAGSLDVLGLSEAPSPIATLVHCAREEIATFDGALRPDGVKERVAWRLERLVAGAGRTMGRGTGVLATIGATAPFVGLFGTVWGIMNSFIGISHSQTTNLAVVAPGIAEALLATAAGLFAAIPAVVIYNVFARAITGYRARLADAVAETMHLLSRDLDRGSPGVRAASLRAASE